MIKNFIQRVNRALLSKVRGVSEAKKEKQENMVSLVRLVLLVLQEKL
jgi:hypothetical protein